MPFDEWSVIARLPTHAEGEVIRLLLEAEGVRAKTEPADALNPRSGIRLLVQSDLVHRAKWVLKDERVTAAELEFLATGRLPERKEGNKRRP
ncbi:MAG: hypothetical protein M0Z60_10950 [Nitrospiraceae bacterium]|nr:hypothetical protein [Nitrospiraceae bacterium]